MIPRGYIVYPQVDYLRLAATILPIGDLGWIQMHGMRLHMGGRTGWWIEGCEDEWVYKWMERMDGWGWMCWWMNGWVGE